MIRKRFIAFLIDGVIASLPILLVTLKYPYSFKMMLYLILILYLVNTSIFILATGSNTLGEGMVGIRATSDSPDSKITKKIFLKNMVIVLFLSGIIVNIPELMGSIILTILLIISVIPDHKDKKTGYLKSILDIVFNIHYIDCTPEVKENSGE